MFKRTFGGSAKPEGTMVIARLNDRAQPVEPGERYEDDLIAGGR